MPGEDRLREFYPDILTFTYQHAEKYGRSHPEQYIEWLNICHDLYRQRRRSVRSLQSHLVFEGWPYEENPFAQMNFDYPIPPSTSVMQTQYDMTLNGNMWLGIGVWGLAEEYYKIAIRLCIVTNDTVAALQNGGNLALCYLAGGDCDNALRLCEQLINASIDHFDDFTAADVFGQASTIVRWCYLKANQDYFAAQHTAWLLEMTPEHASLDSSVFRIIDGVWNTIGDHQAAEDWEREWAKLQEFTRGRESLGSDGTFEEKWGIAPQRNLKLILPTERKPEPGDYLKLMENPTEQFVLLDRRIYGIIGRHVYQYGTSTAEEFASRLSSEYSLSPNQADEVKSVVLYGFATGIRLFVSVVALNNLDVPFKTDLNLAPLLEVLQSDDERCMDLYNRYRVAHAISSVGDHTFVFRFYRPEMDKLPFRYPNSVRLEILSSISQAYLLCMLANEWN
jgi:hypothetical protein